MASLTYTYLPWSGSFNISRSYIWLFISILNLPMRERNTLNIFMCTHICIWSDRTFQCVRSIVCSVITWYNISATLKTHFISQVISDVFGAPVFVSDIPNSAALGSCYRAKHGVYQRRLWVLYLQSICMSCNFHIHVHVSWFEGLDGCDFSDVVLNHPQPECVARPTEGANQVSRSSRSFWTDVHLIKKM